MTGRTGPLCTRRTLPIRRWLALALVISILVPALVAAIAALTQYLPALIAHDQAPSILRTGAGHWTDPAWQATTRKQLVPYGIDFELIERGRTVYRTSADPLRGTGLNYERLVQRLVIGGAQRRIAYIYSGGGGSVVPNWWTIPLAGGTALLLILGAVAWFLRRTLIGPLAATSNAARRIAAGDLTVELPASRVREVAQLNTAFLTMSEELRASLHRQATLEEERRLFVSAIAHDLRTPLFSLRGYLEGLQEGVATTPEKVAHYVQVCREKADALERLIADLFAYTRVEYMEGTLQCAPLDLGILLRKAADGRQREADANGVTLDVDGSLQACMVDGDEQLLGRAVENLLDNALRHTPPGGRIEVRWRPDRNRAEFMIADTGPGIDPRDLPHVFEPMYRADQSRSRDTGGTGLGLTIARRILQAHGGDLVAGNRPTGGAVFSGSVPLLQGAPFGGEAASQNRIRAGSA